MRVTYITSFVFFAATTSKVSLSFSPVVSFVVTSILTAIDILWSPTTP